MNNSMRLAYCFFLTPLKTIWFLSYLSDLSNLSNPINLSNLSNPRTLSTLITQSSLSNQYYTFVCPSKDNRATCVV